MKFFLMFGAAALLASTTLAQPYEEPHVVDQVLSLSISANGTYVAAQDEIGNAIMINTSNKGLTYYTGNYPGNGNCISDNGVLVGQTMEGIGALMKNATTRIPVTLQGYAQSSINGITPDGSRVCGYIANNGLGIYDVPFYCDIDEKGDFSNLVILPYPSRDFFGNVPQFITAVWISDDGHTIIGQVQDSTGFYTNPIVFREDREGNWTYSQPTQSLFNPDNIEIPKWPTFNEQPPAITDYMTTANAQRWARDLSSYENGTSLTNPWDNVLSYMTEEEYDKYQAADAVYKEGLQNYYNEIDEYWSKMAQIGNDSSFALGVMALNPQGTIMAACRMILNSDGGITDVAEGYNLYIFNLEDDTFRSVSFNEGMLVPTQILTDGTVLAIETVSYEDFVLLPGADKFIPFSDYITIIHPNWLPWMQANLQTRIDANTFISTGILSFSHDLTTMCGGYQGINGMFTYIFKGENTGVSSIGTDIEGHTVVYDLRGRKVLDTLNPEEVRNLSKGIYIVNGKKVAI